MNLLSRVKSIWFQRDKEVAVDVEARFEFLREAVSGTMSQFFMARDRQSGLIVGLKLLDPDQEETFEGRFKGLDKPGEGQIALALRNPRIVRTFEAGRSTEGRTYLVMEYLDGLGVNTLLHNRSPLLVGRRLTLIRQMVEAVGGVHRAGFIHRDICPRNFIATPDAASLKLIDFGITLPDEPAYRQPGNRTGTPNYMAPEIVRRRPTSNKVDIFALGVTAYRVCTCEHPWPTGDTSGQAAMSHDTMPPTDIRDRRPDLDPALARTIMSCLAADPHQRPTAEQLLGSLSGIRSETVGSSST